MRHSILGLAACGLLAAATADAGEFHAVRPCRVVDTRLIAGGPHPYLEPGEVHAFAVRGPESLAGQGGSTAGCGIPNAAEAVALNFTVVRAGGPGSLTAWQGGDAPGDHLPPLATVLHFSVGRPLSNEVPVGVGSIYCGIDPCIDTDDFFVMTRNHAAELVVDVYGYYTPLTGLPPVP